MEHHGTAAKIAAQVDPAGPISLCLVGMVLVQEEAVVRLAETVDALLDVAHHEEVVLGDELEDCLLDRIDVLILIDQHLIEAFLQLFGHRGRGQVFRREES